MSNAFWNNNELSLIGSKKIDIYVHESPVNFTKSRVVKVGVYDGDEFIGFVSLPCSGTSQIWSMASVRIYLPQPN